MIHQFQFGQDAIGPLLIPVDMPIEAESEVATEVGAASVPEAVEGVLPFCCDADRLSQAKANSGDTTAGLVQAPSDMATPLGAESGWAVQSVWIEGAGATDYGVSPVRRRSSPPVELIGVGVLGATLLSGFAMADSAKQAQTAADPTVRPSQPSPRTAGRQMVQSKPQQGLVAQMPGMRPELVQPEMARPELVLPPPPVRISKDLTAMTGLSLAQIATVSPRSFPAQRSQAGRLALSMPVVPIAAPDLVRVARSTPLSDPVTIDAARSESADSELADLDLVDDAGSSDVGATPLSQVSALPGTPVAIPDGMPAAPLAGESATLVPPQGTMPQMLPLVESPVDPLTPTGTIVEPALPSQPSLEPDAMAPIVTPSTNSSVQPRGESPAAVGSNSNLQSVIPETRALSQTEAISLLGALSHPEFGPFVHQSLNARDYAEAVRAQQLGSMPPFGFIDYQNQRIVLPADLTASLPGSPQLQSLGLSEAPATGN